jgi:hypothetical protein
MFPKIVREFEKGSNLPDASISAMWRSLGKKNPQDASAIKGKAMPSSSRNAKANMAKEGSGTIFSGQHCLSQTLASVEFVKDMMEQNNPECPYEYVLGKEFLPDFALECNKRLLYMRVFQMWYLEAVELSLESVLVNYPANDIFATDVEFSKLAISFEDIQFLYRQKRLDVSILPCGACK